MTPLQADTSESQVQEQPVSLASVLSGLTNRGSRLAAVKTAVTLWEKEPVFNRDLEKIDNDDAFFQLAAARNQLKVLFIKQDPVLLQRLNLPAILELSLPNSFSTVFLTLVEIDHQKIVLKSDADDKGFVVSPEELKVFWAGNAYVLWRDFFNYDGNIPGDAPKESIMTLKILLREIGFKEITLDDVYDALTEAAVKQIQQKHGIEVDGIVGTRTKIAIYNEKKDLKIPRLRSKLF